MCNTSLDKMNTFAYIRFISLYIQYFILQQVWTAGGIG